MTCEHGHIFVSHFEIIKNTMFVGSICSARYMLQYILRLQMTANSSNTVPPKFQKNRHFVLKFLETTNMGSRPYLNMCVKMYQKYDVRGVYVWYCGHITLREMALNGSKLTRFGAYTVSKTSSFCFGVFTDRQYRPSTIFGQMVTRRKSAMFVSAECGVCDTSRRV